MKRPPSKILILNTILTAVYYGSCVGLGIWETL